MDEDVQLLSQQDDDTGVRVYQLSPQPDAGWWQEFHRVAGRRLAEVGMHPSTSIETGYGGDQIRLSGITPETSLATDQWLARVVHTTNTNRAACAKSSPGA